MSGREAQADQPEPTTPDPALDVSVVVPTRNAEAMIDACLRSIIEERPRELIVVDGLSTDRTVEIARSFGAVVLSDHGKGVAAARQLGAERASSSIVAFIDVDVVLHRAALSDLVDEFLEGDYAALQAGLHSTSGPGYWGRALVDHHRSGVSKGWFGLVATIMRRDTVIANSLDPAFESGEDIEIRWRLQSAGARTGVSTRTVVEHRFGDTFAFARGQFLADGSGLARMTMKHGWRAAPLLALPAAAAARGAVLSLLRGKPQWIPYYSAFWLLNWIGMARTLWSHRRQSR